MLLEMRYTTRAYKEAATSGTARGAQFRLPRTPRGGGFTYSKERPSRGVHPDTIHV